MHCKTPSLAVPFFKYSCERFVSLETPNPTFIKVETVPRFQPHDYGHCQWDVQCHVRVVGSATDIVRYHSTWNNQAMQHWLGEWLAHPPCLVKHEPAEDNMWHRRLTRKFAAAYTKIADETLDGSLEVFRHRVRESGER